MYLGKEKEGYISGMNSKLLGISSAICSEVLVSSSVVSSTLSGTTSRPLRWLVAVCRDTYLRLLFVVAFQLGITSFFETMNHVSLKFYKAFV